MNRRTVLQLLTGIPITISLAAFYRASSRRPRQELLIASPQSLSGLIQSMAKAFGQQHPNVDIWIDTGESISALLAVKRDAINIAGMARDLETEEDTIGTASFLIGRTGVVFMAHDTSAIQSISSDEARSVFSGKIANWSQLGLPPAPLSVVTYSRGSAERKIIDELVLEGGRLADDSAEVSTAYAIAEHIRVNTQSLGCLTLADAVGQTHLKHLDIDGVAPSRITVLSGRYPYTVSFDLVTHGAPNQVVQELLTFSRSSEAQAIVASEHLVSVYGA